VVAGALRRRHLVVQQPDLVLDAHQQDGVLLAVLVVPDHGDAHVVVRVAHGAQGEIFGQGEPFAVAAPLEHLQRRLPVVGASPVVRVRHIGQPVDGAMHPVDPLVRRARAPARQLAVPGGQPARRRLHLVKGVAGG